jgi:hypothetical protein
MPGITDIDFLTRTVSNYAVGGPVPKEKEEVKLEGIDFLSKKLVSPKDFDPTPTYDDTGGSRLDANFKNFDPKFKMPESVMKGMRGVISLLDPRKKIKYAMDAAMYSPAIIRSIKNFMMPEVDTGLGITMKVGDDLGETKNISKSKVNKKVSTINDVPEEFRPQLEEIFEKIRTGKVTLAQGAEEAQGLYPKSGFFSKKGAGIPKKFTDIFSDYKSYKNFNEKDPFKYFSNVKITAKGKPLAEGSFRDFTPSPKKIAEVLEVIKMADKMNPKIDYGIRFSNAFKNFKLGKDAEYPDKMQEAFGTGNWNGFRSLADEMLKFTGRKESAFMKFPKNAYKSADGKSIEFKTLGESFNEIIQTFDQKGRQNILNATNEIVETAGRSTKDDNYINQVKARFFVTRFVENAKSGKNPASNDEIIKVLNNVNKKDLGKVLKVDKALRDNFKRLEELGIDTIEKFDLSHMEDVATNWKTALDANNLFFTSATKNQGLQKSLNKEVLKLINKIKNSDASKIDDLQLEVKKVGDKLKEADLVSIISGEKIGATDINYINSAKKMFTEMDDELFFPEMMRTGASPKKDGGMVGISHLTRPLGNF